MGSCSRRTFLGKSLPAGIAAAAGAIEVAAGDRAMGAQTNGTSGLKLLFSGAKDVTDSWGRLTFGTTSLHRVRACKDPGFTLACCVPRDDGAYDVFGQVFVEDGRADYFARRSTWQIVRATTRDGETFEDRATVLQGEPGCWTGHLGIAYNPLAREYLALKLRYDRDGFGYMAFFSADGRTWREHPGNPLFRDCDSLGLFWSPVAKRFICTCKSLQPVAKHLLDHGGRHPGPNGSVLLDRRVLCVRSSADGRRWDPPDSLVDVWNTSGKYRPVPTRLLTVPDRDDPPDMEFYRGIGFWYHDRSYLMVLNYAASPLSPNKHGPQLDTEWWVSRDGLRWDRPDRDTNALGDAFPRVPCITHNPLLIGDMMLFHFGDHLVGMKRDRISYVGARANAEFTTREFTMPDADLLLNAAVPSSDRGFATDQAYVMLGILDERNQPLPAFAAESCVIRNVDAVAIPLRWNGRSARELAGRRVRLRIRARSASVYAVTG